MHSRSLTTLLTLGLALGVVAVPPAHAATAALDQPAPGPWALEHDASPAFTPDGSTVIFARGHGITRRVLTASREGSGWSAPQPAPFSDGDWMDLEPAMAPDGSFLVFTSNRPDTPRGQPLHGGHLWRVDRHGDGWGTPVRLSDAVNDGPAIFAPSVAANGDVIYQRRDEPGHEFHLYRTAWRNGRYQPPQRLALGDPRAHELDPAIAPDGSFLVFDANYAGKDLPDHLYIAFRDGDGWSTPLDLGEAVDRYEPWGSHLGPDGKTLYFTSNYTVPVAYPRSPAQARADLERMRAWDNGNNHIWRLSLSPWLAAHRAH